MSSSFGFQQTSPRSLGTRAMLGKRALFFDSFLEEGMDPREAFAQVERSLPISELFENPTPNAQENLSNAPMAGMMDSNELQVVYHNSEDWFSQRTCSTRSELFTDLKLLNWFTPEEAYQAMVDAFSVPILDNEYIFIWLDEKNLQVAGIVKSFTPETQLTQVIPKATRSVLSNFSFDPDPRDTAIAPSNPTQLSNASEISLDERRASFQEHFRHFSEICIPAHHLVDDISLRGHEAVKNASRSRPAGGSASKVSRKDRKLFSLGIAAGAAKVAGKLKKLTSARRGGNIADNF